MRVAQLDRASDYGSEGREFESSRARSVECCDRERRGMHRKALSRLFLLLQNITWSEG